MPGVKYLLKHKPNQYWSGTGTISTVHIRTGIFLILRSELQ